MLVDKPEQPGSGLTTTTEPTKQSWRRPLRWLLSLVLTIVTIWYVSRDITLADIGRSLQTASVGWILLGFLIIGLTGIAKAWRWQQLFLPRSAAPRLRHLYWSMLLGQFINLALWRFGDLARVYDLNQRTGRSKTLILSTIVVEKSLHLLFILLTLLLFLPFISLPQIMRTPAEATAWVLLPFLFAIYLLAFQTEQMIRLLKKVSNRLPAPLQNRLLGIAVAGLEGLAALRDRRAMLALLLNSALIACLEIATPLVLFYAFNLPYGLLEAAALNLTLILGFVPPSTPLKIGVFEWLTMFVLAQFAPVADSLRLSYALMFHVVVVAPTLVLGFLAMTRSRWRWPKLPV